MQIQELPRRIVCILICQSAGIIGSFSTSSSVSTWYATLNKPEFTPPGWIISTIWIILFTIWRLNP